MDIQRIVDENGVNVFDEWYKNDLTSAAQAKVDWLIEDLFPTRPFIEWGANHIKKLESDIYEVRFEIDKICYRPLGAFAPKQGEFTFLIGVTKKNDRLNPKSAITTAIKRLEIIKANPERAKECEFE